MLWDIIQLMIISLVSHVLLEKVVMTHQKPLVQLENIHLLAGYHVFLVLLGLHVRVNRQSKHVI